MFCTLLLYIILYKNYTNSLFLNPLICCIYSHIIFYDVASDGSSKLTFLYHIRLINCYAAGLHTFLGAKGLKKRNLSLTKPKDLVVQQFVHWIPQNLFLLLLQAVHIYVCVCVMSGMCWCAQFCRCIPKNTVIAS